MSPDLKWTTLAGIRVFASQTASRAFERGIILEGVVMEKVVSYFIPRVNLNFGSPRPYGCD
jgi:hypothetical protein